jgi:pilus assembly protein CpaB
MKFRATILALLVASVGGLLLWTYLKRFESEASGGAKVGILVTMKTLEPGALVREEDIGERWIPQAYVETRAIRIADRQRIVNLRTSTPLQAQQSLMWTDIVLANDDRRDMSALVQQGMRAVTIRAEGKAATLVRPGDRVDVIGVFPQPGTSDAKTSVVLLQNVLVLGRDRDDRDGQKAMTAESSELALSLSLQHSQILAVAGDKGKLSVALRSPDDVRVQEGLVDISSTILAEAEKRIAMGKAKPTGPVRLDAVSSR